jgi:hypothetical protein
MLSNWPESVHMVDRLLDPVDRATLPPAQLDRLINLVAHALHNAYLLGGVLAVAAFLLALMFPARLSPTRH